MRRSAEYRLRVGMASLNAAQASFSLSGGAAAALESSRWRYGSVMPTLFGIGLLPMLQWLSGHKRVRPIDLRLALDPDGLEDWQQLLSESAKRVLRLPHVYHPEPLLTLSGSVDEQPGDGPIAR